MEQEEEQPFQALDNLDPKVRKRGALALGQISPIKNRHMEACLDSLNSGDDNQKIKTIENMGEINSVMEPVVAALITSSRDFVPEVRAEALRSLELISGQLVKAFEPLKTLKASSNALVAQTSDKTMSAIRDLNDRIVRCMISSLHDNSKKVRITAEKYVSRIKKQDKSLIDVGTESIQPEKIEPKKTAPAVVAPVVIQPEIKEPVKKTPGVVQPAITPIEIKQPESKQPDGSAKKERAEEELKKVQPVAEPEVNVSTPEMDGFLKGLDSFELMNRRFALLAMVPYIEKEAQSVKANQALVKKGDIILRVEAADNVEESADKMTRLVTALCRSMEDVDKEIRIGSARNLARVLVPLAGALITLEAAPKEIEHVLAKEKVEVDRLVQIQIDQFKKSTELGREKILNLMKKAVPVLLHALEDKVLDVRNTAGESLKSIQECSLEVLPLSPVWEEFFKSLNMTSDEFKVRLLVNDLENPGVNTARKASREIGDMGASAKPAIPALVRVIRNKENLHVHYKYVKTDAMDALGKMGPEAGKAAPALVEQLDDIRFEIRNAAVQALGRIGGREGVARITEILETDKSSMVRESASAALAGMDPAQWVDKVYMALFKALKGPSKEIRLNAFNALAAYEVKNRGAGIIKWKPAGEAVTGYRVCLGAGGNENAPCFDTGLGTSFRLGEFKGKLHGREGVSVKAFKGSLVEDVPFTFIDIRTLLEKSTTLEPDRGIRTKKEKALLELMEKLLNEKEKEGKKGKEDR